VNESSCISQGVAAEPAPPVTKRKTAYDVVVVPTKEAAVDESSTHVVAAKKVAVVDKRSAENSFRPCHAEQWTPTIQGTLCL
jgi:hypothetical protein